MTICLKVSLFNSKKLNSKLNFQHFAAKEPDRPIDDSRQANIMLLLNSLMSAIQIFRLDWQRSSQWARKHAHGVLNVRGILSDLVNGG